MVKPILRIILFASVAACSFACNNAKGNANDPLVFPKDNFIEKTKIVKTSNGDKKILYRSYMHIQYVANPINKNYQSLNVSVPIKINDKNIDAANAPILFIIGVGGYVSVNNARSLPNDNMVGRNTDLALAAGYVVVFPGCRGRDNKSKEGTYYGKAPAAIVDLKAAVRYIKHNKGIFPGNVDWIFSTGVSAGGALSALLGASGNSPLYESYLEEIGAADADDNIYGSACFCPITDLEHADCAYEWMYGDTPTKSGLVDQKLSKQLKNYFAEYQSSLNLQGKDGFGILTADNYDEYLLKYYLIPSANKFLNKLSDEKRNDYLAKNKWIGWRNNKATFSFRDFVAHVGRMKGLPAFDDFNMKQPEPILFGNKTINARHFTDFSLRHATGNKNSKIDNKVKTLVNMMNAMYFVSQNNSSCAKYWWLRQGTSDNHTSQTVIANLAASLENKNKNVNTWLYWDAGHGANEDPENFISWMGNSTGYKITDN